MNALEPPARAGKPFQIATALGIVVDALIQLDEIRPPSVPDIDALDLASKLSVEEWERFGAILRQMHALTANRPESSALSAPHGGSSRVQTSRVWWLTGTADGTLS